MVGAEAERELCELYDWCYLLGAEDLSRGRSRRAAPDDLQRVIPGQVSLGGRAGCPGAAIVVGGEARLGRPLALMLGEVLVESHFQIGLLLSFVAGGETCQSSATDGQNNAPSGRGWEWNGRQGRAPVDMI